MGGSEAKEIDVLVGTDRVCNFFFISVIYLRILQNPTATSTFDDHQSNEGTPETRHRLECA